MTLRSCLALGSLLFAGSACSEDVTCPQWAFPAINLLVISAADGSPVLTARGEVRVGSYADSLLENGSGYYSAGAREGIYTVHVEREGFAPWDTSGIWVRASGGSCSHLVTEEIQGRLTPTP